MHVAASEGVGLAVAVERTGCQGVGAVSGATGPAKPRTGLWSIPAALARNNLVASTP